MTTKRGRSTGEMLKTMGLASSWPNKWIKHYDHDPNDDPMARLQKFQDFAAKLDLSYDFDCKGTTVRLRFTLEV